MASLDKANVVAHIWLVAPFKTSPPHELFTQVSWTRNQWRRDGKFQIIGVNSHSIDTHLLETLSESEHQELHVVVRPQTHNELSHVFLSPACLFLSRVAMPVASLVIAIKAGSSAVERAYGRRNLCGDMPFTVLSLECASTTLIFVSRILGQFGPMQAPYWFLNWLTGNVMSISLITTTLTGILIHRLADAASITRTANFLILEG